MWASRKRKGIAGVLVAVIVFGMLFTIAANYYLVSNQASVAADQAGASRQDALSLDRSENLVLNVGLLSPSTLVVSAFNTGGVPVSISSIYLATNTGSMISPPGLLGPAGTNVSSSYWPITLNVGGSTNAFSGCGTHACRIALTSYTYSSGTVFVNVVTGRGNVFSFQFPPLLNGGVASSALVLTISANPTQVQSCKQCINVNVVAYNFASVPLTGVTIVPTVPTVSQAGTASAPNGNCIPPSPANILAYSPPVGPPPSITFQCTYDAKTGTSGGFVSFTAFAQGYLGATQVTSAQAVSNNVQIGGELSVPTQGAFSVNFFFFKSSSCTSSCSNPTTFANLPQSGTISVGSNHYVAFYMNITNNFPATLEILQYSFLQLDASHPPPNAGNESDWWLAGAASSYNVTGRCTPTGVNNCYYFPNYTSNPHPQLTQYTGTVGTCSTNPLNTTYYPNCLHIGYQRTITLTMAACGYGSKNWDWGGSVDAQHFDNSAGCTSSTPSFSPLGAANILTLIICFEYKGQTYTQGIQFQGLAVIP